jgi:N-acetylneuraminate synthase
MDMVDLEKLNKKLNYTKNILGKINKESLKSEEISRNNARRSLVSKHKIQKGQCIELDDLTWKRPASGISPMKIDSIIGMRAKIDIIEDTVITKELLVK